MTPLLGQVTRFCVRQWTLLINCEFCDVIILDCILDVGFLLDGSGSVTLSNWIVKLSFVQRFGHNVNFGKEGTRIGVVSFGNRATVNIRLDQFGDVSAFEKAVHNIPYKDQNTNTASGLRALRTKLFTEINGKLISFFRWRSIYG